MVEVAERIRRAVEGMEVAFGKETLKVTISLGCCVMDEDCPGKAEDVIERADKALYRSKGGGRNRVSVFRKSLLDMAHSIRK